MGNGIPESNPNRKYAKYFRSGILDELPMHKWVHKENGEGNMPGKIADEREGQAHLKVGGVV